MKRVFSLSVTQESVPQMNFSVKITHVYQSVTVVMEYPTVRILLMNNTVVSDPQVRQICHHIQKGLIFRFKNLIVASLFIFKQ